MHGERRSGITATALGVLGSSFQSSFKGRLHRLGQVKTCGVIGHGRFDMEGMSVILCL